MDQALPDFPSLGRYLICAVLVAVLVLCALILRKPGGGANGTVGALPANGELRGAATVADQTRRRDIAGLGPIQRSGVNGADVYANALALYSQLSDADKEALSKWSTRPDLKAGAALFRRIQPILALLRRARTADYVEWGNGDDALNVGSLGDVALWGAAYQFQAGPRLAVAYLADAAALSRAMCSNYIGLLVGSSLDSGAYSILAQNAPLLPEGGSPDLDYFLDPAAGLEQVEDAVNGEIEADRAVIDKLTNAAARSPSPGSAYPEVVAQEQWAMKAEQAFLQTVSESDAQFAQWLAQVDADPARGTWNLDFVYFRMEAERELVESSMIAAGIALEQGDQAQFQSINDPATGAPFIYTQSENGFQLTSGLKSKRGAPVTLGFPWVVPSN